MVMLSQLRRFDLVDARRRHAKLVDFAVALLEGDYPPVTHLIFRRANKQKEVLPWAAVQSLDLPARRVRVADLDAGRPESSKPIKDKALLRQDIMDALVLDLQNRRATRANDLWLEEENGQLLLRAADTSARALLRRLSQGRYGGRSSALYDWKYIEFLCGDPKAARNGAGHERLIARLPPGEIARLCNPLPYLHVAELITLLPDPIAADTLEAMMPERQLQVFEELDEKLALRLLAQMAPDIAADLVGRLQTSTTRRYLERLPREQSERIIDLLRYPEDTVGGIMTNDVVFVRGSLTVAEARHELRERLKGPDFVFLIYVVDEDERRHLRGWISLRNLLTADDRQKLEEIMDRYVTTLHPLEQAGEAAYRVLNSHLAGMPVVNHEGRLLGVVTVDAALTRVAPPGWSVQLPRVFS